jgi:hypothetical protein
MREGDPPNVEKRESMRFRGGVKMRVTKRWLSSEICIKGGLIFISLILMLVGCASSPKEFDPKITGPQLIVEPDTIRLGVAKVMGTQIVFRGKGFVPEDSVFISLVGVKKKVQVVNVPIADGNVDKNGAFTAKVGTLAKVGELLRAEIGSNKKMENVIILSEPPIPEGVYTARAVSMESDKKAECKLVIKGPSVLDRLKDWMGGLLGKIKKK